MRSSPLDSITLPLAIDVVENFLEDSSPLNIKDIAKPTIVAVDIAAMKRTIAMSSPRIAPVYVSASMFAAGVTHRIMKAGAILLPFLYSPETIGITVHEQAAINVPVTEANGKDMYFLLSTPRYLIITSLERKLTIAPARRNHN